MTKRNTTAPDESEAGDFKASDLLKLAGLTYRQLNDWENRAGVLDSRRATDAGWRKFTAEEVLALCVCASLRRQFALPLEKVGGLAQWLLGKWPDTEQEFAMKVRDVTTGKITKQTVRTTPVAQNAKEYLAHAEKEDAELLSLRGEALARAFEDDDKRRKLWFYFEAKLQSLTDRPILHAYRLATLGNAVYLFTDFERSYILTEYQLEKHLAERLEQKPFIVCPLNDAFNKVRVEAGKPVLPLDQQSRSFHAHFQKAENRKTESKTSRHGIPEPRSSVTHKHKHERDSAGCDHNPQLGVEPRVASVNTDAPSVVHSRVKKSRRQIAHADSGEVPRNFRR